MYRYGWLFRMVRPEDEEGACGSVRGDGAVVGQFRGMDRLAAHAVVMMAKSNMDKVRTSSCGSTIYAHEVKRMKRDILRLLKEYEGYEDPIEYLALTQHWVFVAEVALDELIEDGQIIRDMEFNCSFPERDG